MLLILRLHPFLLLLTALWKGFVTIFCCVWFENVFLEMGHVKWECDISSPCELCRVPVAKDVVTLM